MSDHINRSEARDAILRHLAVAHRAADVANASRAELVRQARMFGATWDQIGEALGMTRQAAHKRFSNID
jgi:hypothetical protein